MKILIAADGNTLDSRISKRFGKGAWYLIVDLETMRVNAFENVEPRDHHEIVPKAAE
ncbi:MAG: NifB/NifX family molybdenum-iron cluster-binding protein [Bacteroidota bacterium]